MGRTDGFLSRALAQADRRKLEARFWAKVDKQSSGCWTWTAGTAKGSGMLGLRMSDGSNWPVGAHRIAWWLTYGRLPAEGKLLAATHCNNKLCVNPDHREEVTPKRLGEHRVRTMLLHEKHASRVREVRRLRERGLSVRAIGEQLGLSRSTVGDIVSGRSWSAL